MNDQESLSLNKAKPAIEEGKDLDAEDFGKDIGHLERMTKSGWINIDEHGSRSSSPKSPKEVRLSISKVSKDYKDKPAN